jgi:hypothetical protein
VPIEEFVVNSKVELGHEVNTALLDMIVLLIGLLEVSTELLISIINTCIIRRIDVDILVVVTICVIYNVTCFWIL